MKKTVKFFTLGCKVNQYDTQSIREHFLNRGFKEIHNGTIADMCVVNTCTVTSWADRQSRYIIRRCIKDNPLARVIVTGCLAEKDAASLSDIKGIDYIISKRFLVVAPISGFEGHTRAFLKIQDGCDNRCSYCKVPLVRGNSKSRQLTEIVQEANKLVKNGFKEIVLCGICLGSFGKDLTPKLSLVNIIEALEEIEGLWRIRLSSIEAGDITDTLIKKIADSGILCRHLHIPMQSGDDSILRRMNRTYLGEDYLRLVKKIKRHIPQVSITTDIMIGFPGETEKNFENTVSLVKKIMPLRVHIFPYSPRKGTVAFEFNEKLNPLVVKERLSWLRGVAEDCSSAFRRQLLNENKDVLIEEYSKENPNFWHGYTDNYIKVLIKSRCNLKNQLISVTLKKIEKDFMVATSHFNPPLIREAVV